MIRSLCLFLCLFLGSCASAESLRLAVTTSFENSGLAGVLLPRIKADIGLDVQLLVVGTGQAIRLGTAGDVDAILVHSRQAEEDFVAAGHATHRREIMYNDFVLIGPVNDPAGITQSPNVSQAMRAIKTTKSLMVSRGDDSGTHKAELSLWATADLQPDTFGQWYLQVGAGMGAALNTAAGLDAYLLADRASWLKFGHKANLALLFSGDAALFNQYAYLPVSPEKGDHIQHENAKLLENWLTSAAAKALINSYQINGEQLFTFNATDQ